MEAVVLRNVVTVSPKFQVVIPQNTREHLHIRKGQKMVVFEWGSLVVLVPSGPIKELEGKLPKMSTDDLRDHSERF